MVQQVTVTWDTQFELQLLHFPVQLSDNASLSR